MEEQYLFEAEKFGLSDKSIHLLRNRYNYKTIDLEDVDSIIIAKGKDLNNWAWVLFIGVMLLTFVAYDLLKILNIYGDENTHVIYLERLLIPLFPFVLGIYTVLISLRNSKVMRMYVGSKKYHFSLRRIIKANCYDEFIVQIKGRYKSIRIN
ncbi:hypothetical protein [Marinifilum sp. D737]|uniref:hypothetical protein n=1 Tax=Marinifilum sp. D737 TaxID=2969628 RepID=UPI0022759C52|nr:hypothetical protein [Marinifilum sp. D737]MCY1633094.1 hypothetical protein [Marinifilum sp. D737]